MHSRSPPPYKETVRSDDEERASFLPSSFRQGNMTAGLALYQKVSCICIIQNDELGRSDGIHGGKKHFKDMLAFFLSSFCECKRKYRSVPISFSSAVPPLLFTVSFRAAAEVFLDIASGQRSGGARGQIKGNTHYYFFSLCGKG